MTRLHRYLTNILPCRASPRTLRHPLQEVPAASGQSFFDFFLSSRRVRFRTPLAHVSARACFADSFIFRLLKKPAGIPCHLWCHNYLTRPTLRFHDNCRLTTNGCYINGLKEDSTIQSIYHPFINGLITFCTFVRLEIWSQVTYSVTWFNCYWTHRTLYVGTTK
jgi:hypothetical protein